MKVPLARTTLVNEPDKYGETKRQQQSYSLYELTKRTQEMLFADWAQYLKAFFVPNQEPAFA